MAKLRDANSRCKLEHSYGFSQIKKILLALGLREDMNVFNKLIDHIPSIDGTDHIPSIDGTECDDKNDLASMGRSRYESDATFQTSQSQSSTSRSVMAISSDIHVYEGGILSREDGDELRAVFRGFGSLVTSSCPHCPHPISLLL